MLPQHLPIIPPPEQDAIEILQPQPITQRAFDLSQRNFGGSADIDIEDKQHILDAWYCGACVKTTQPKSPQLPTRSPRPRSGEEVARQEEQPAFVPAIALECPPPVVADQKDVDIISSIKDQHAMLTKRLEDKFADLQHQVLSVLAEMRQVHHAGVANMKQEQSGTIPFLPSTGRELASKQAGEKDADGNLPPERNNGQKAFAAVETASDEKMLKDEQVIQTENSAEAGNEFDHFEPGNVTLEIIEAKGLHGADTSAQGSTSDPYVKVHLRRRGVLRKLPEIYRTHTKYKTVDPVWNEVCKFEVAPDLIEVTLELWDHDNFSSDDLLGRVSLQPADILCEKDGMENWFVVSPHWDCPQASGLVKLRTSYQQDEKAVGTNAYFQLQRWSTSADLSENDKDKQKNTNSCDAFVRSKRFDSIFCGLIVLNAVLMLVELEYNGRKSMGVIGLDEPGSNYSPALESFFYGANFFFMLVFCVELICRLVVYRKAFVKAPSNGLDVVIVLGSIIDVIGDSFVNLTFLRLMRLTKLARIVKAAMMTNFCEPLRILFSTIVRSFGYLFWSFLFLVMVEVTSALLMTQLLADYILDETLDLDLRIFVYTYYGTTSRTFLTMFEITMATGAWNRVGRPIIEDVHPAFALFFVGYVGGVSFAVIKIIAALFLRKTLQVAAADEQGIENQKVRAKREASESIRASWNETADALGKIRFADFEKLLKSAEGHAWLSALELSYGDACGTFDLNHDGSGALALDDFLSGLFRMAQPLKQIDLVLIHQESKKTGKMIEDTGKQLNELLLLCHSK